MLKNYILIAFRQFTRHKMFSALNVFCVAIGISFCLLMGQYILHETAVNANLKNVHRQYFLNSNWKIKNTGPEIATIGPLARSLKRNYPGLVSNYYHFNPVTKVVSDNGAVEKTLSIFSLVALCILLLVVINFVNIMIGSSSYRLREIGLRKVFGGSLRSE